MHDVSTMPQRLGAFLTARDGNRVASVVGYVPMIGGYSRMMARADIEWSDGAHQTLVLRGDPPAGHSMMETDRDQEWALLSALGTAQAVGVPSALLYDPTGEELGTKCMVIEHVDGPSLQTLLNDLTPVTGYGSHVNDLVDTMARVHSMDSDVVGDVLERPGDWDRYIGGLINRFREADAGHVESVPFLRFTAAWLDVNRPPALPLRVVHSDFQPANIMVDPNRGHMVVDWELTHIGDPREDLGYYNVYSSASGPNLFLADPEGFLARYRQQTGFGEDAVNMSTMGYFSALAAITVYAQILGGVGAMSRGSNSGLMTTYILNALTVGHNNFMAGCAVPVAAGANR